MVSPLWTNSVNSITCPPRKTSPSNAVENSQIFPHFMSPRCTAASASTIIRLDIRRSNVLTDVKGMFRISCGYGPTTLRRSEEHTSELQSRLHLVCRLLLEKKKEKPKEHENFDSL